MLQALKPNVKKKQLFHEISFEELRRGFELAVSNAFSLVNASMILVEQIPQVALGLSQIAQEELGKSLAILAAISLPPGNPDWGSFWRDWKDHDVKAFRGFYYDLLNPARVHLRSPEGRTLLGLPRRSSIRAEKEASFYLNFNAAAGTFVAPDVDVTQEEMLNRVVTVCSLVQTAFSTHRVLEERDSEFRFRALSGLIIRAFRELLTPPQMPRVLAEFGRQSPQHRDLLDALNRCFADDKAWFTGIIDQGRKGH